MIQEYSLVSSWHLRAPIDAVWGRITDVATIPEWWPSWKKCELRGAENSLRRGSLVDCELKGLLPYLLRYQLEIVSLCRPFLMEQRVSGDLVGTGRSRLDEEGGVTTLCHEWNVGTSPPLLNLSARLSFFRRLLENNHARVMAEGCEKLRSQLERPLA